MLGPSRRRLAKAAFLGCCFVLTALSMPRRAAAHPIDEYVQSSYLTITRDSVLIELDLAAGMAIGSGLLALIDIDRDGAISAAEGNAYAALVLRDLSLSIDGGAVPVRMVGSQWPPVPDLLSGNGVIHLFLSARPVPEAGSHQMLYRNTHAPLASVYLANTFVPDAPVTITAQDRDWYQREIRVDYRVGSDVFEGPWVPLSIVGGVVVVGVVAIALARRSRASGPAPPA